MTNRYTLDSALRAVAVSDDRLYGILLEHGTLELGLYKPDRIDRQQPHDRDEVYIVHSGSGWFRLREDRRPFEPGEALFVPAGVEHRFEDFSADFVAWVIFYGPPGGERG
jgi:mannose-6-phosphate isomerase-like protein (cupin superfamily)